jgi:hypothetical protein
MNIVTFTVEALQKHQMWYALSGQYENELTVCVPTGAGFEPYNGATAYKMFNGRVVLGFDNTIQAQSQNGVAVIGEGFTEYVSTQPYERIKRICEISPPNDTQGTFTFTDSQPINTPDKQWRCDSGRFGPFPYPDLNGEYKKPISDRSVLIEYEPILSVPGIAHLVYLRRSNFSTERHEYLNNALTQMATATLPEMFVLLHEWSMVTESPFDNNEEIAKDAKEFLQKIHFITNIIDGYPSMQISRFLSGDNNARQRPETPLPPSESMLSFIKSKTSHLSLASLLTTDPSLWDVVDIAELEKETIKQNMLSLHKQFYANDAPSDMSYDQFSEYVTNTIPVERRPYVQSWLNAYKVAEETRNLIDNTENS